MTVVILPYICDLCSVMSTTSSHYVVWFIIRNPAPPSCLSSETHTDRSERRESTERKQRGQRTIGDSMFDPSGHYGSFALLVS